MGEVYGITKEIELALRLDMAREAARKSVVLDSGGLGTRMLYDYVHDIGEQLHRVRSTAKIDTD